MKFALRRAALTMWPPLDTGRLKAANINPATGLATDYLNLYNEIAMTIANLADLPDMRDSVLAWRRPGYPAHFVQAGLAERGLAIAAYIAAPRQVKAQILATRADLDSCVACIARLGGVINGGEGAPLLQRYAGQDQVDSFFS